MKEIIAWLQDMEQKASDLYRMAAELFRADSGLSLFMSRLAEDEIQHRDIIKRASACLGDNGGSIVMPFLIMDKATKDRMERPLRETMDLLSTGDLTKGQIMNSIVTIEFSEWNDIFLYVVNTLQQRHAEFQGVAAIIQDHEHRIELFFQSKPETSQLLRKMRELPVISNKRLLVVDDDTIVVDFLKAIFKGYSVVDGAGNGEEALEKVRDHYYNAIISDLRMPVMNGIEFFEKAKEYDPRIEGHFIFYTSLITPELEAYCEHNHLRCLEKPVPLEILKKTVHDILHQPSEPGQ